MYISGLSTVRPPLIEISNLVGADGTLHSNGIPEEYLSPFLSENEKAILDNDCFPNTSSVEDFIKQSGIRRVRVYNGQGASELAALATQQLFDPDDQDTLPNFDYIFYCHSSIDKEFMISPACRMQYVTGVRTAIPMSISQFGMASTVVAFDIAKRLFQSDSAEHILVVSVDQLVYPAIRRFGNFTIAGDAAAVAILSKSQNNKTQWEVLSATHSYSNDASPEDCVSDLQNKLFILTKNCVDQVVNSHSALKNKPNWLIPSSINKRLAEQIGVDLGIDKSNLFDKGLRKNGYLSSADTLSNIELITNDNIVSSGEILFALAASLPGVAGLIAIRRI